MDDQDKLVYNEEMDISDTIPPPSGEGSSSTDDFSVIKNALGQMQNQIQILCQNINVVSHTPLNKNLSDDVQLVI